MFVSLVGPSSAKTILGCATIWLFIPSRQLFLATSDTWSDSVMIDCDDDDVCLALSIIGNSLSSPKFRGVRERKVTFVR